MKTDFGITSELIGRCRLGDDDAWREMFSKTCPLAKWAVKHKIFNCSPDLVDELAQETMVALSKYIGKIKDEAHLRNFVVRAACNKCINYMVKHREAFVEVPETIPDEKDALTEINERERDVIGITRETVAELKEPCRTIIRSRFLEERSYKEIAEKHCIDIKQLGVRLKRCVGFLRRMLEDKNISLEDVA